MHNVMTKNPQNLSPANNIYSQSGQTHSSNLPKLICILGPAGTGKSGLALYLARHFNGAIINLDSRQVYLSLPIITAQPDEQSKAQCPHFLYGFLPCTQKISAGIYVDLAHEAIALCGKLGLLPILVGGTGFYVQTLLQGIASIPEVPTLVQNYWQMRCQRAGTRALHAELTGFDPIYAAKINPNDKQRVTRALAVYSATGRPLSWWHAMPPEDKDKKKSYSALKIGLKAPLDELKPRLAQRIEQMLSSGALDELKRAVQIYGQQSAQNKCQESVSPHFLGSSGCSGSTESAESTESAGTSAISKYNLPSAGCIQAQAPGLSSIGCVEILHYLNGQSSLEQCCELWLNSTRAYAKRQLTWFNRDKGSSGINWFSLWESNIEDKTKTLVEKFLSS